MRTRWYKVLRDIIKNPARTSLVVLSISIGVLALGFIIGSRIILLDSLNRGYQQANPASVIFYTDPVNNDFVRSIAQMEGVIAAQGQRVSRIRVAVNADQTEWRTLVLFVYPDFTDMQVHTISPEAGEWPPPERSLLIERDAFGFLNTSLGNEVVVETPDGKQRRLPVVGTVHDINEITSRFNGEVYAYVTPSTMEWLGLPRNYDQINVRMADPYNTALQADIVRKLERAGLEVYWERTDKRDMHPAATYIDTFTLILTALGGLSLFLSGFLVTNTISAILNQQMRQVGIMKAIGASTQQLFGLYLGMIGLLGLMALLLALPLSIGAIWLFTNYIASLINFEIGEFYVPTAVYLIEVGVSLGVSLLAGLYPVWLGTAVPIREALNADGIDLSFSAQRGINRLLGRLRGLSRPLLVSLRNLFRQKTRLALTLITMILGSATFVGVTSVYASLLQTLDDANQYWQFDIWIGLDQTYRATELNRLVSPIEGVVDIENWRARSVRTVQADGSAGSVPITLFAPPIPTTMLEPIVLNGRWLTPEDSAQNAAVINTTLQATDPSIQIGDTITLNIDGRETDWVIVGLIKGILADPQIYVSYGAFASALHDVDQSESLRVRTIEHTATYQGAVAGDIETQLAEAGVTVTRTQLVASELSLIQSQFQVIIIFLAIMAVLIAAVGSISLTGAMSLNVIERRREIGVMRAIGAANPTLRRIIVSEGIFMGIFSWVIGSLCAIPIGQLLSEAVGETFLRTPLSYRFSIAGVVAWLLIIIMISIIASLLPAKQALRITVRDVLAYE